MDLSVKLDRRDSVRRHRLDFIVRELSLMGPDDMRAKEIVAGLKLMRIDIHLRTVERILAGLHE